MARITDGATTIVTRAGIQPSQYAQQLRDAGFLQPLFAATGATRLHLEHAANQLVRDLRSGRINEQTKTCAAELGLRIYPN